MTIQEHLNNLILTNTIDEREIRILLAISIINNILNSDTTVQFNIDINDISLLTKIKKNKIYSIIKLLQKNEILYKFNNQYCFINSSFLESQSGTRVPKWDSEYESQNGTSNTSPKMELKQQTIMLSEENKSPEMGLDEKHNESQNGTQDMSPKMGLKKETISTSEKNRSPKVGLNKSPKTGLDEETQNTTENLNNSDIGFNNNNIIIKEKNISTKRNSTNNKKSLKNKDSTSKDKRHSTNKEKNLISKESTNSFKNIYKDFYNKILILRNNLPILKDIDPLSFAIMVYIRDEGLQCDEQYLIELTKSPMFMMTIKECDEICRIFKKLGWHDYFCLNYINKWIYRQKLKNKIPNYYNLHKTVLAIYFSKNKVSFKEKVDYYAKLQKGGVL